MSFHGLPCWYELGAQDADAAQGFYSAVLGWGWRDAGMPGMDYRLALAGEVMVAGMICMKTGSPFIQKDIQLNCLAQKQFHSYNKHTVNHSF